MTLFKLRGALAFVIGLFAFAATPAAFAWGWNIALTGSGVMKTESRDVSGFKGLGLAIPAKVELRQGGTESLSIEAEDNVLPLIETVVENNILKIRWKEKFMSLKTKTIKIALNVNTLESLSISGSGDVRVDQLTSSKFTTSISGSGDVAIKNLIADTVKVSISGSGDFSAGGKVKSLEASIAGSGDLRTGKLEANNVKISIAGSGDALVWAREALAVSVAGSGDVRYYGDPSVSQSVAGSGSLKRLGAAPAPAAT